MLLPSRLATLGLEGERKELAVTFTAPMELVIKEHFLFWMALFAQADQ